MALAVQAELKGQMVLEVALAAQVVLTALILKVSQLMAGAVVLEVAIILLEVLGAGAEVQGVLVPTPTEALVVMAAILLYKGLSKAIAQAVVELQAVIIVKMAIMLSLAAAEEVAEQQPAVGLLVAVA